MKSILLRIFLFLLVFSTIFYKSQKVTVRGIAKDTTKNSNTVLVVVNDTLRKESKRSFIIRNWDGHERLRKNKDFVTTADKNGNYQIKAKLTDTLYFYNYNKYYEQKYKVADIIKNKIKVELKPEPCVPYVACEQKQPSNFYIFVAEKISGEYEADPYYCKVKMLDGGGMKYTYKIKEEIYGDYPKDTIVFKSYSHLGRPMIEYYDTVLLFVGEYCGKLYQEKYQFFDLYKTKDGRWASPGDPYKFDKYQEDKTIKAQSIDFDPFIRISTIAPDDDDQRFQKYEAPYYRLIGDKAVPLMGAYIKDLIKVKMGGSLKNKNIDLDKIK
ncbi:hypothetical protein [Chryseobacterium aquaticum]|uniref:hypothetical protein n=1 Tax=Chryseobacterium aquaticum TaxID=452084 RepID=UPI003F70CBC5